MLNEVALVLSGAGVGGLLGVFAKALLDKRHLRFSKLFEYKERRYGVITILMWVAINPSEYEFAQLKKIRPELTGVKELNRELELEYHNAMIYASKRVLKSLRAFNADKSLVNCEVVTRAMKKDLYI